MKKTSTPIRLAVLGIALFLLLAAVGCDKGDPTAQSDWQLKVSADPGEIVLDGNETEGDSTIEAYLFDKTGNPQKDVPIVFKVTSGDGALDTEGKTQKTDERGRAKATLTARSESTVTAYAASLEKTVTVKVSGGNKPPVAVLTVTPKDVAMIRKTVTFSGGNSTDPDDGIEEYQFTITSNNPDPGSPATLFQPWSTAMTYTHEYQQKQTLTLIKLEVKDKSGAVSYTVYPKFYEIDDNEGAPTAKLNLDGARIEPIKLTTPVPQFPLGYRWPVTASGCMSTDVGDGKIKTYVFIWGDGTSNTYEDSPICSTSHSYNAPGEYTVKLVVYDDGDGTCGPIPPDETSTCPSQEKSPETSAKIECLPIPTK